MALSLYRQTLKPYKFHQRFSAVPPLFIFLIAGKLADYLTTFYGFHKYASYDIELNPIARYSFKQWGILPHLLLIGFVLLVLFRIMPLKGDKSFGANLARGAVLLASVIFWACALLNVMTLIYGRGVFDCLMGQA